MTAASAYAAVAKSALAGRELQAAVLMQCALDLKQACEALPQDAEPLHRALAVNRDAWCIIGADAFEPDARFPADLRGNLATITAFMLNRTIDLSIAPTPDQVEPMITINRHIAAGLRGQPLERG